MSNLSNFVKLKPCNTSSLSLEGSYLVKQLSSKISDYAESDQGALLRKFNEPNHLNLHSWSKYVLADETKSC